MLNIEKVKHMTKAAAYETGKEKQNIKISNYFRTDYMGLQIVYSALAYTAAYVILTVIWVMAEMEVLLDKLTSVSYIENLVKQLIVIYVIGLFAYEFVTYMYYSKKHQNARKSVKGFQNQLRQIHKFYETQETAETILDLDKEADEETEV